MPAATEAILNALNINWNMVQSALKDLTEEDMARRINDQSNSVSWILWHMTRVVDTFIHTRFQDKPQLWIKDGWHARFGMEPDPENRGVGWTAAQVGAWRAPAKEVQIGYFTTVNNAARDYIGRMTEAELSARRVVTPVPEPRSIAAILGQMTWDNIAHGGQIAYLRGVYRGMGWHR